MGKKLLAYVIGVATRLPAYSFVFFLIFLEWLVRTLSGIDSQEFVGPTLAAAASGVLVPLTTTRSKLSGLPASTQQQMTQQAGFHVTSDVERALAGIVLFFVFALTFCWAFYLVCKKLNGPLGVTPIELGALSYLVACFIAEVKEAN
jgi:hypothetical protein